MVSMGYSVVVPIEVPPDIPDSLLFDLRKLSERKDIMERLRHIALKEINKTFKRGIKDVQPILVRKGKPIEPPPDSSYSPNSGCIRKRLRTCIGGGWTSSERSLINSHLSRVLPIIEDIYGQAFMTDKWWRRGNPFVKIIKEDFPGDRVGLTCAPWYAAVCFVITGEFPCTLWPWDDNGYIVIDPDGSDFDSEYDKALLTHELFHAFRLNWILTYPQFEEGHAEAGTIIATKELCRSYGDGCEYLKRDYIHSAPYMFHQYYNLPFMGTNQRFEFYLFSYSPIFSLRYKTWSYLWIKTYLVKNNFFTNFNDLLCSYSPNYFRYIANYNDYKNDLTFPAFGSGTIESLDFPSWFNKQPAFKNDYDTSGNLSHNIAVLPLSIGKARGRDSILLGIFYYRRRAITEDSLPYRDVRLLIWGPDGYIIKDTVLTLDSQGKAILPIYSYYIQKMGRIKVEVCDKGQCEGVGNMPPIYSEIMLGFPYDTTTDIMGAVAAERGLSVRVGSYYVRDTNGYFRSPENIHFHTVYVGYISSFMDSMDIIWLKDSISQWIYPNLYRSIPYLRNLNIPPARPQGFHISFLDTTSGVLQLVWNNNKEADMEGYKIYKSEDFSTFSLYRIILSDTILYDSVGPCISHRYFITAFDIWGNEGEPTDTIEVLYTSDEFPCLLTAKKGKDRIDKYEIRGREIIFHTTRPEIVRIYDVSGRRIYDIRVNGVKRFRLNRGVYFIQFKTKIKKEVVL